MPTYFRLHPLVRRHFAPAMVVLTSSCHVVASRVSHSKEEAPVAIVDCGSGYTRVKIYSHGPRGEVRQSSGGRVVRRTTSSGRQMPPLHTVLFEQGDPSFWIQALHEVLRAEAAIIEGGDGAKAR